jgi:hypothetical protein
MNEAGGRFAPSRQQEVKICRTFSGSDGTRTRDLRRDRPVRGSRRLATIDALSLYSCGFAGFSWFDSAWLGEAVFRRLLPVCCPGSAVQESGSRPSATARRPREWLRGMGSAWCYVRAVDAEIELTGGRATEGVARSGETVRRATGPWTPTVHAYVRHLEERGFAGAPRVLGIACRPRARHGLTSAFASWGFVVLRRRSTVGATERSESQLTAPRRAWAEQRRMCLR